MVEVLYCRHAYLYKKWECMSWKFCGHIYDEELGHVATSAIADDGWDEEENLAPGTRFECVPDDWCCPDCGATKELFMEMKD